LKRAAGDLRKAAEIRTLVVNKSDELQNAMTHLAGQIETVRTETANRIYEIGNATKHVGGMVENSEVRLTNLIGDRLRDEMAEGIGRLLAIESELPKPYKRKAATCPISTPGVTFGEALRRAQADFPRQFSDWLERLAAAETAIEESVVGNLAYAADPYSRAFRNFVDRHAAGTVLDIGCGTHGRPVYLSGIPADQLFGLEPLLLRAPFDFPVVRGIAEYMPWENHSFDTAVSATAIDHALSLDRTLDEIVRVLVPNGTLLMWVGSNAGARPFKPDSPDYEPADRFHLFHIDRLWFEPVLETRFMIEDRVVMWTPSHEHVFYKLSVRSGRGRECLTSRV
jgi:SAM-dependent methyltransferase